MTLEDFFDRNLNKSLLIGYYGGGNFGDELLLEVLLNILKNRNNKDISIYYSNPHMYPVFHHDFGYRVVDAANKTDLLKRLIGSRNVIIGGGGLWGLDFNSKIFLLSILLFLSRYLFGKRVYLLGVGYYSSTNLVGNIAAYFAAAAANLIFARDRETLENFSRFKEKTHLIQDMAFCLPGLDLQTYENDLRDLEKLIDSSEPAVLVGIRRFREKYKNTYADVVRRFVDSNETSRIILASLEPAEVNPEGLRFIADLKQGNPQVQSLEFRFNPIALYLYFKKYSSNLRIIAPQYHLVLISLLTGVRFLPFAYDNKVVELLKASGATDFKKINEITLQDMQEFLTI